MPAIPESLNSIVMRLLDPKPENRFESTQALVAALTRLAPDGSIRSDVHEVIVHDAPRPLEAGDRGAADRAGRRRGGVAASRAARRRSRPRNDPISVLIGDFENKTGDAVFDGVVEQALSLGIEGASFINAFPRRDALRAAEAIKPGAKLDEETARLVAFRENLGLVMVGAIEPRGSGYHITIKGVGPGADGEREVSRSKTMPTARRRCCKRSARSPAQVRAALGDTVAPAANDAFTAANLEAVRAYARGQELLAAGPAGRRDSGISRGDQRSIRTSAAAYSSAATAANNLGRSRRGRPVLQEGAREDRSHDRARKVPHPWPVLPVLSATQPRRSKS